VLWDPRPDSIPKETWRVAEPSESTPHKRERRRLPFDRLAGGASVEVVFVDDIPIGGERLREPHRHDYHEFIWIRAGSGVHLIDGRPIETAAETITVIGRGQVHQFHTANNLKGGVLRFTDEVLHGGGERIASGWLLTGQAGRVVRVPRDQCPIVQALFEAIADETRAGPDAYAVDLQRHRISMLVLLVERWYDQVRVARNDADDGDVQLHRRFAQQLEADFSVHHDAGHYARALGLPAAALAQALGRLTGRSTKELIIERVMLEATRLLRFTDLAIGTISHRVGFADQLYFSRAFKRSSGHSPLRYRQMSRGV
jgi:AraC family transcriptional regulator, transcriptional activator of pobA